MTFQRRHYEIFARDIRSNIPEEKRAEYARFCVRIFEQDNPLFNRARFITACGVVLDA